MCDRDHWTSHSENIALPTYGVRCHAGSGERWNGKLASLEEEVSTDEDNGDGSNP